MIKTKATHPAKKLLFPDYYDTHNNDIIVDFSSSNVDLN